jgi:hypothetical protein
MVWLCAELLATEICHSQNEHAFNWRVKHENNSYSQSF